MSGNPAAGTLWVGTHRAPHFDELAALVMLLLFTEWGRDALDDFRKKSRTTENAGTEGLGADNLSDLDIALDLIHMKFVSDGEPAPEGVTLLGVGGGAYDDHASGNVRKSALGMLVRDKREEILKSIVKLFGADDSTWAAQALNYLKNTVVAYADLMDSEGLGYSFDVPSLMKTMSEVVSNEWDTQARVFRFAPGGYTQEHAKQGLRLVGYLTIALMSGRWLGEKGIGARVDEALAKALLTLPGAPWAKTTLQQVRRGAEKWKSDAPLAHSILMPFIRKENEWQERVKELAAHLATHAREDKEERDGKWRSQLERELLEGRPHLDARHFKCPWSLVGVVKLLAILDEESQSGRPLFEAGLTPNLEAGERLADWGARFLLGLWWQGQGHFQRATELVEADWKATQKGKVGHLTAWQAVPTPNGQRMLALWMGGSAAGPKALRKFGRQAQRSPPIAVVSFLHGQVDERGAEKLLADGSRLRGVAVMFDIQTFSRKEMDWLCRTTGALLRAAHMRLTGRWPAALSAEEASRMLRASERLEVPGAEPVFVPSKPWRTEDGEAKTSTRAFMVFVGASPSHPLAPQASANLSDTAVFALVRLGIACTFHPQGHEVYGRAIGAMRDAPMSTLADFQKVLDRLVVEAEKR